MQDKIKSIIAAGLSFGALSIPGFSDALHAAGGQEAVIAAFSAVWTVTHGLIDYFHGKTSAPPSA